MSLANSDFYSIVKKQYLFKLKSYIWFFFILIIVQCIFIFGSLLNLSSSSNSYGMFSVKTYIVSTFPVLVFTILCAICVIMKLGSKELKGIDFSFVASNTTNSLSNIAFLITYGLFGAVTSALSAAFIRVFKYVFTNDMVIEKGFYITPVELLCSIASSFLYILLFISIFYFFSILIQKSKMFIMAILALLVVFFRTELKYKIIYFYRFESIFVLFFMKVLLTALLFFTVSVLLADSMEVER